MLSLCNKQLSIILLSAIAANAYPRLEIRDSALPDDLDNHPYMPQQPEQDRSPCPALNTLANHGYLPRDGKKISRSDLSTAFSAGWGVAQSVIATPTENAFSVCELVHGDGSCPDTFDLSDLNDPHSFEHDHSLSREDYFMLYAVDAQGNYIPTDNHDFNRTIFGTTLQVLGTDTMGVAQAQQVRLQREHLAYIQDPRDSFRENRFTQETELGFVFSVMRNFAGSRFNVNQQSSNQGNDQTVMVDWWMFWFSRQQFPTDLGWRKPVPDVEVDYITSIRSAIAAVTPTSTPSPLPPHALDKPTEIPVRNTPTPGKRDVPAPTPAVQKRDIALKVGPLVQGVLDLPETIWEEAASKLGPSPTPLQVYDVKYSPGEFKSFKAAISSYGSALDSIALSLAGKHAPRTAMAEPTPA